MAVQHNWKPEPARDRRYRVAGASDVGRFHEARAERASRWDRRVPSKSRQQTAPSCAGRVWPPHRVACELRLARGTGGRPSDMRGWRC